MPMIGRARILRMWGGTVDMSMDGSPFIDKTHIEGLYFNGGWCYGGFKATPAAGKSIAQLISTGETPDLIKPFGLSRFHTGRLVNERAAAPAAAIH